MVDKIFGLDFANDPNPSGSWTISINNGTVLKDVSLAQILKIIAGLSADTSPAGIDSILTYDASANDVKQVLLSDAHLALTQATTSQAGTIELATSAETLTGTDTTRGVTPSTLHDILTRIPVSGMMINGKISVTVASNNITLALKTLAGADASAADPIYVNINGTIRTITAALSVTVNAGAASGSGTFNAGAAETATLAIDYFPYLSWRAASSAVVIGFARFPGATVYSDFSGTASNEKYGAFSTAPASTDDVCVIGRFEATNSGTASYNWSVPSYTSKNLIQKPIFSTRWLTWVPTWTGLTIGNGTQSCSYKITDEALKYQLAMVWGSTTSISATVSHTLPFSRSSSLIWQAGTVRLVDSGTITYAGITTFLDAKSANITAQKADATYLSQTALSSTIPHTWATSDEINTEQIEYPIM